MDIFVAALFIVLLSPLMALLVVVVRRASPGPAIFTQQRLTKNGVLFNMYKFRTMRVDAEATSGAVFAAVNDPRVTPLGKLLRQSRLDELPQLLNVLRGEMSLVGPRPERPEIMAELMNQHPNFTKRLKVRAGLTGLAQVSVGYCASSRKYRHKLKCDLAYVQNKCLLLDLWILYKTVDVVRTGKGAC